MNDKETGDHLLLARIQNGEEKAFNQLFLKYYPGLMRYCKTLLPYPSDEAEDIILEVFYKIWQQREALNIHTSFASFLYIAVKNKVHDYYRKRNIAFADDGELMMNEVIADHPLPDELLMYKQLKAEMDELVAQLPERTQLVFRMNREDNLSYDDIALILNVSVNTVKTQMYRALKFLKETYHASGKQRKC